MYPETKEKADKLIEEVLKVFKGSRIQTMEHDSDPFDPEVHTDNFEEIYDRKQ